MFAISVYKNNLHFDWLCNLCQELQGCELVIDDPKNRDDPDINDFERYSVFLYMNGGCCQDWPECELREKLVSKLREKFIILTEYDSVQCPRFPGHATGGYQLCARP